MFLSCVRTHGAPAEKNSFKILGDYMYSRLDLLHLEGEDLFVTLPSSVVRTNKIKSITILDTLRREYPSFKRIDFDASGRMKAMEVGDYEQNDRYEFSYDSLLLRKGVQRFSSIEYPTDGGDDHIAVYTMQYDMFGNIERIENRMDSLSVRTFRYENTVRYQYVHCISLSFGYPLHEVFRYDKWTGKIYHSMYVSEYELLGTLARTRKFISDTVRFDYSVECLDTVPDGRNYTCRSAEKFRHYVIQRDSCGRVVFVGGLDRFESWIVIYGAKGLPRNLTYSQNSDGHTREDKIQISYSYY